MAAVTAVITMAARSTGTTMPAGRGTAGRHRRGGHGTGIGGEGHHDALHAALKDHLAFYHAVGGNGALVAADQAALLDPEGKSAVLHLGRGQKRHRSPLAGGNVDLGGLCGEVDGGLTLGTGSVLIDFDDHGMTSLGDF
jgi:hypothetical protein